MTSAVAAWFSKTETQATPVVAAAQPAAAKKTMAQSVKEASATAWKKASDGIAGAYTSSRDMTVKAVQVARAKPYYAAAAGIAAIASVAGVVLSLSHEDAPPPSMACKFIGYC